MEFSNGILNSNAKLTLHRSRLRYAFCDFSQSNTLSNSQMLTLIRTGLLRLIVSLATAHKNHLNCLKLQLYDAIYRLRFYSNSLIHILPLSKSHNNVASLEKNRGDKSHRVIVILLLLLVYSPAFSLMS